MKVTIDRIEENKAVLIFDNSQELLIDITELPKDSKEGDVLEIIFQSSLESAQRQQQAKAILNEILGEELNEN